MASLPAEVQVASLGTARPSSQQPVVYQVAPGNVVALSCPPPPSSPQAQLHFFRDDHPLSGIFRLSISVYIDEHFVDRETIKNKKVTVCLLAARVSSTGSLLLANVTVADTGRYSCSASNPLTGQSLTLPYIVQLRVEVPSHGSAPRSPHFLAPRTSNYTVLAGGSLPQHWF